MDDNNEGENTNAQSGDRPAQSIGSTFDNVLKVAADSARWSFRHIPKTEYVTLNVTCEIAGDTGDAAVLEHRLGIREISMLIQWLGNVASQIKEA
jgi:hypothetical protein